ncbi:MAG: PAS domain-containing protein [Methanomicrobiaceae archaeon]|nr:PAS domain-containing protein [Methanomicrobiaceae archaeon]
MDLKNNGIVVFIVILIFVLLVVQAAGLMTLAGHNEKLVLESTWNELEDYAVIMSTQIDGDLIASFQPGDESRAEFIEIRDRLWALQKDSASIRYVYVLRKTPDGEDLVFVTDSEYGRNDFTVPLIGYVYEEAPEEAFQAYFGPEVKKEFYSDEWGEYMSGYAPIYNSGGNVVGVACVDISKDIIMERLEASETTIYYILIVTVIIGVFLLVFLLYMVSQFRRYQFETERSERRLNLAMEIAQEGIIDWNSETETVYLSRGFWRIVGDEEKTPGTHYRTSVVLEYVHPDDRLKVVNYFRDVLENGFKKDISVRIVRKNGEEGWVRAKADVVGHEGEESARLIATVIDITGEVEYLNALESAREKLSTLSSVTRHDVLNQVTILNLNLDLLKMINDDPEIDEITGELDSASDKIRDLIEFTKYYPSLGDSRPSWISVDEMVENVAPEGYYNELPVSLECRNLMIYADPLFEKVIYNLFDNTYRYGEKATVITVCCRNHEDGLVLSFEDDGVGIPGGKKELIFEKNYGTNTGYGLFLVEKIIEMAGFVIRETGEEGVGARFEVLIPKGKFSFYDEDLKSEE